MCWFQCTAKGKILQAKRYETTVNRDEMQVKGKQQPVVNVRGVGDAAPYSGGHLCACTVGRGALTPPHSAGPTDYPENRAAPTAA